MANLATNFNLENKGIFPYKFVNNKNISLNYEGDFPSITDYDQISMEEYQKLKQGHGNINWNLRKESIKYCEQDVKPLYLILKSFQYLIYNQFKMDILKYPTLPSLAFAIYRSNFLTKDNRIPLIHGEMFDFFKKGYTGGNVDVYIPYGKNLYSYDVNSLYPYVMKSFPMPIGNPIQFEGDITLVDKDAYGFFEVEVVTPKDMHIPLLQCRIKTNTGNKTITPLGKWTGVYHSEEIKNAKLYGYKFNILRGYLFEKEFIFSEYVESLYEIKVNSKPGTPNYIISKLLLNSLYGRFGMNLNMETHIIIGYNEEDKYIKNHIITSITDLKNGKQII